MSMKDKIKEAAVSSWLTDGLSRSEIEATKTLGRIATEIAFSRSELHMTQKEFAKHMGVSQGMVSKWESGEYNFTIETLFDICEKLDLRFEPVISKKNQSPAQIYQIINGRGIKSIPEIQSGDSDEVEKELMIA